MTRRRRGVLGVCAATALALLPTRASESVAVRTSADGRLSVTIDVPQGHYDEWYPDTIEGAYALKTKVTSVRLGPYGEYSPMFAQTIQNGSQHLMLKVSSRAARWPQHAFAQHLDEKRQLLIAEENFALQISASTTVDLTLSWTRDGTVCMTVEQGGKVETRLMKLNGAPTSAALFASSGAFRFDEVELVPRPAGDAAEQDFAIKANCVPVS